MKYFWEIKSIESPGDAIPKNPFIDNIASGYTETPQERDEEELMDYIASMMTESEAKEIIDENDEYGYDVIYFYDVYIVADDGEFDDMLPELSNSASKASAARKKLGYAWKSLDVFGFI